MRASGDSEYVFATTTLPRPLGLTSGSVRWICHHSRVAIWKDSKQTTNRGQHCAPVSFMQREKASARTTDGLVKSGLRIKIDSALRRECLDHVIVLSEESLRRTLRSYFSYYNRASYCPTLLCV